MRSVIALVSLLFIAVAMPVASRAQSLSPEMVEAGKKVAEAFDQNLKGWTRKSIVPIQGSSNVIVENWNFNDRVVRISIATRSSEAEESVRNNPAFKRIEGIGDEAVVWGYEGNITFRFGHFGASVSSSVDLNLFSQDQKENAATSRTEAAATSRLIACFINLALSGKLAKTRSNRNEPIFQRPCEQELVLKRLIGEDLLRQLMNGRVR